MDIYCKTCGEPWDMDTLHDEIDARIANGTLTPLLPNGNYTGPEYAAYRKDYDRKYEIVRSDFYRRGCKAMEAFCGYEPLWCKPKQNGRTLVMAAAIDLMGDDIDGIASMMDDADYMGMLD